jgi:hypothetical protein
MTPILGVMTQVVTQATTIESLQHSRFDSLGGDSQPQANP